MSHAVIDPTVILARALAEAARLARVTSWSPAFAGATPDAPMLVQRLDNLDAYYYLVSFGLGPSVTARLSMNAHTGTYEEGIGIGKSGDSLQPYYTPGRAYRLLARLSQPAKKKTKGKKTPATAPVMTMAQPFPVWKPCAQSFSVFMPFYLITVGPSRHYVRFDGKVFDRLTTGAGL